MNNESLESRNINRWMLLIINVLFLFETAFPVFENKVTLWTIKDALHKILVTRYSSAQGISAYSLLNFLLTICLIFLVVSPLLHILKLVGLLGETRRNSRAYSSFFSLCELVGVFGVPALYCAYCFSLTGSMSTLSVLWGALSVWTYIWFAVAVIALVLSGRLLPTDPIIPSLTGRKSIDIICDKCGRKNPYYANFCLGCGNPVTKKENKAEIWYCPRCGTKNTPESLTCSSCGSNKPKEY